MSVWDTIRQIELEIRDSPVEVMRTVNRRGRIVGSGTGTRGMVLMQQGSEKSVHGAFASIHNHTSDSPPSIQDLFSDFTRDIKKTIVVTRRGRYVITVKSWSPELYVKVQDSFRVHYNNEMRRLGWLEGEGRPTKRQVASFVVHMNTVWRLVARDTGISYTFTPAE